MCRNVRQDEPHNCALHQILLGLYQQEGWTRHTARSAEMRSTCDSWVVKKKAERPGRRFKDNNNNYFKAIARVLANTVRYIGAPGQPRNFSTNKACIHTEGAT